MLHRGLPTAPLTPLARTFAMRGTQFAELSAFVAVAEHRNFTKAAAQLGVSPSTLSQTIRSFEERLGVRLLNRTTRSVALTEAGEQLFGNAQSVLDGIGKAIESVNSFRDKPIGTLRLSMPRVSAVALVGPLLPQFLAEFPEIKLEMNIDDSHSDWDGSIQPWVFENAGRRLEVPVDGSLILNDIYLVLNAVLDGIGIGYLIEFIVSKHVADGELVPLLGEWWGHFSGVYLYYPSRRQVPGALRAFIDFMRNQSLETRLLKDRSTKLS